MSLNVKSIGSNKAELQVENGNPITIDATGNIDVHSLNGGQLAGFRNKIINGRFNINQAGAASRIATPNAYNYDQWYYDGTYLYQPIPTEDVVAGIYTLSWEGSSTAAWSFNEAGSGAQSSIGYAPVAKGSQINVPSPGAEGQHLWIRFQGDLAALDKVQLEPGNVVTPFEHRPYSLEQDLCEYFFSTGTAAGISYASSGAAVQRFFATFRKRMRSTPSVSLEQIAGTASTPGVVGTPYLTGVQIGFAAPAQGYDIVVVYRASARI